MRDSVDTRYANALFSLAKEKNLVNDYQQNIKQILDILNNTEANKLLLNEFLSIKERCALVDKFFANFPSDIISFIKILLKNHRYSRYEQIFKSFNTLCNEHNGVLEGLVYSVEPLTKKKVEELEKTLGDKLNKKVELSNRIDASLLGGVKVVINDRVYDGSIKTKLENMRNELATRRI